MIDENKIETNNRDIIKEKKIYCLNCGKIGHTLQICNKPTTSYGIINFKFIGKYEKYNNIIKNTYITEENYDDIKKINLIWYNNKNNHENSYIIQNKLENIIRDLEQNILILLISRKHSLGYIEFIRGRYEIDNLETVKHLFDQMTEKEIIIIHNNDFNYLWNNLWKKTARVKMYEKEYMISLNKYNNIMEKYRKDILEFKPKYPICEWGFPKGKRNYLETDLDCAIRECTEETALHKSEIKILNKLYPIIEVFKGTNNINYKHVYFLSLINSKRNLYNENNIDEFIEIDNIGWFTYNKIKYIIRPYHIEKKKLIRELIIFLGYNIYQQEEREKNI